MNTPFTIARIAVGIYLSNPNLFNILMRWIYVRLRPGRSNRPSRFVWSHGLKEWRNTVKTFQLPEANEKLGEDAHVKLNAARVMPINL
jgi:hypothetical protein